MTRLTGRLSTIGVAGAAAALWLAACLGTAAAQSFQAQTEVRMTQLERQVQELRGTIEQLQYQNQLLADALTRALNDLEYRLVTLEGGDPADIQPYESPLAPQTAPVPAPVPAPSTTGAIVPGAPLDLSAPLGTEQPQEYEGGEGPADLSALVGTPDPGFNVQVAPGALGAGGQVASVPGQGGMAQYDYAMSLFNRRDYAGAELALRQFLNATPNDPLAPNAQFWLGEALFEQGRMDEAAQAYQVGLARYPGSTRELNSLFKLGIALGAAGRSQEACGALIQFEQRYPGAPPALLRRSEQERARMGCR